MYPPLPSILEPVFNDVNSTYPLGNRHISTMAAIADSQPLAAWLDSVRNPQIGWHIILNNSTSMRPKIRGGKLFPALTNLYVDVQDNDRSNCILNFPCSFAPGDGLEFQVPASGGSVNEARNAACKLAFAYLLRQRLHLGYIAVEPLEYVCKPVPRGAAEFR